MSRFQLEIFVVIVISHTPTIYSLHLSTTKPPPGHTCHFQLRLCLDPGKCWYLPPWAGNVWHNHEKQGAAQKRRRMATLSQQHQYEAGVYSRHGTSGQTSGILNELHGNTFSSSQINYNKKKQAAAKGFLPPPLGDIESNPNSSDAENVIRFLNQERAAGNKEYMHFITRLPKRHCTLFAPLTNDGNVNASSRKSAAQTPHGRNRTTRMRTIKIYSRLNWNALVPLGSRNEAKPDTTQRRKLNLVACCCLS